MTWPRPVPLIGDRTSAAQRAADPAGWAYDPATIQALHTVIAGRRDIRRYRPDPIPDTLLREVLAAGHQAPSVGHAQPWRFLVVTEQATRDRAALLADRGRLRQAELLEPDRRARLLDLQLEGIREAPTGIVVACDRRTPPGGVLGRATYPDTDLWSCACAIQNIWLAARAAGLGLGWVTLFQPADLAALLHLPGGVETLGWLCLGWPNERPPEPGLQRHGWSHRLPLEQVVLFERWPEQHAPESPPSHLAGPAPQAVVRANDSGDDLLSTPGSLGALDRAIDRVLALPGEAPTCGTLLLAAADHPVAALGVSAYPPSVTTDVLAASLAGDSLAATTARETGLRFQAHHARASNPQGDILSADALTRSDTDRLLHEGTAIGHEAAKHGLVSLGEVGIGNTTLAAAMCAALLGADPAEVVGLGAGADTAMLTRKRDVVTRALQRATAAGLETADPVAVLAALGGPEIALLAGATLGAAAAGSPIILDGLVTTIAALVAVRVEPAAATTLVAGQRSRERAHPLLLTELGLEPLLDLRLRAGEGVGACLTAQMLLTALRVRQAAGRVQ
jgi:nicotinate-nucleotide--dimethylbenzimidazole phosphoribosyltransferase